MMYADFHNYKFLGLGCIIPWKPNELNFTNNIGHARVLRYIFNPYLSDRDYLLILSKMQTQIVCEINKSEERSI